MKKLKRDLILLRKEDRPNELSIAHEVACINQLLQSVETDSSLCNAHELIDLNRFKILHDTITISKALKLKELKPFQFLFIRN